MLYGLIIGIVLGLLVHKCLKKRQAERGGKIPYSRGGTVLACCIVVVILIGLFRTDGQDPTPPSASGTVPVATTPVETSTPDPTTTPMVKPGIKGSNAYDLSIGAKDNGLDVGGRQATSDGYSWLITGSSLYGSYTISVETNKQYEIHRAVFSHAGNDVTFFPWAVTLPFEAADIDGVTAWVNACQKASRSDTLITGDAVWTYKPHDNGQHGGVLTLTVDTFEEYSLYLLDQIE